MTRPPLIGLVGRRISGDRLIGNLDVLAASPIDVYFAHYAQSVIAAGGLPVWLPIDADPAAMVDRLDGIVMTGGTDIDPARYGADASEHLLELATSRDTFEFEALDAAADRALPVLGICRGLQAINVHAGGTLHQHVPEHACFDSPPSELVHEVSVNEGSVLADCYGALRRVNSLHHQQIADVGSLLRVTARCPDGGVEGIEHESLPWVAVQWHPEMLETRDSDPIFSWLVEACGA